MRPRLAKGLLGRLGQALDAQRAFVADAAHELRSPLTALKLQAQVLKRLQAGEPFPRMAADASDSSSKANGGLLGEVPWTDISPELQKELQPLKAGQLTRVLRTTRGYQILKVDERTDGTQKTLEEAREQVSEAVFESKRRGEFSKYLERLRTQAIIEWKNDEVKKAYDAGVKAQADEAAKTEKPGY